MAKLGLQTCASLEIGGTWSSPFSVKICIQYAIASLMNVEKCPSRGRSSLPYKALGVKEESGTTRVFLEIGIASWRLVKS